MRHGIVTHRSLPPFFHTIPSPLCGTALYTTSSNNVKKLMKLPISFVSFYQSFFIGFVCVQSYSASTKFFFVVVVVGRDLTGDALIGRQMLKQMPTKQKKERGLL